MLPSTSVLSSFGESVVGAFDRVALVFGAGAERVDAGFAATLARLGGIVTRN